MKKLIIIVSLILPTIAFGAIYKVQKGDTLNGIANDLGVDVRSISGYRSGNPDLIFEGERLRVNSEETLASIENKPVDTIFGAPTVTIVPSLKITGLPNENCIGTDSAGLLQSGTCTGGGGSGDSYWTKTGTFLNTSSTITRVGILTISPSSTLHVVGTFQATGASSFGSTLSVSGVANLNGLTNSGNATTTSATITGLTASRALVSDANKSVSSSAVTATELGYLSGVTSAIQTQIDGKQATLTTGNLTASSPLSLSATRQLIGGAAAVSIADAAADGSTKGAASFTANDFDATSGNIAIDYTNGQAASAGAKGFLTSADWSTFNSKLGSAITSLNGLTGASQTFATSTASNIFRILSSGTTHTLTIPSNVGFFSNDAGYLTGNQTITLSGDVSGSGATAITTTIGNDKILESMLKAVDTPSDEECLTYEATVGDFEWQSCAAGSGITSLNGLTGSSQTFASTTGSGFNITSSGTAHTFTFPTLPLSVANGGTGTSTTPTALKLLTGNGTGYDLLTLTAGTNITISTSTTALTIANSITDGSYLTFSGSQMNVDNEIASSTIAFNFYDATSTAPYKYQKVRINFPATIQSVYCDEYASATTTINLYKATSAGFTNAGDYLTSITCGIAGNSTTTFSTTTIPADTWLVANTTSTAGTPTLTTVNVHIKKTD